MYLSATNQSIQIVLGGTVTTNQLAWTTSWQEIDTDGMILPQSSSSGLTNNTTDVDIVAAPAASITRQVTVINVYNADTVAATVIIKKQITSTDYTLINRTLQAGDTLQWTREVGWQIVAAGSQQTVTFQSFTSGGTWTKPAGLKRAYVVCVGAGGGGGSGRQGATNESRFGGGGGGGGAIVWRMIAADDLATTVTVTIGAAGTGGAAQASTSNNGNAGTAGGDTSFGALVIAKGGSAGGGGTTIAGTAGAGGLTSTGSPVNGPYAIPGGSGSAGTTNTASTAATTGFTGTTACPSGAGGGGINSANTSATTAGGGGGVNQNGIVQAGPVASASVRPDGSANQSVFLHMSTSLTSGFGVGTGGAGGYPGSGGSGAGGFGGNYGAGGGGGTGTLNGTSSGRGGDGAGGLCVIMEIF